MEIRSIGGPRRELFRLAWPIFLEVVLFSVIGSVDVMMLSGYSDNAVGAVGVANQIVSLFQVLCSIVTTGTGILCAQYIGAGRGMKEKQPLILAALLVIAFLILRQVVFPGTRETVIMMANASQNRVVDCVIIRDESVTLSDSTARRWWLKWAASSAMPSFSFNK